MPASSIWRRDPPWKKTMAGAGFSGLLGGRKSCP